MAITPHRVSLMTERMLHFIAEGLLYHAVPITLFFLNYAKLSLFPEQVTYLKKL